MKLRFFNIDLHVSVIEDVKTIWKRLFTNIEIVDWSISGHKYLFSHAIDHFNPILNGKTWRDFDYALIHTFQQQYDNLLKECDGFIVTHSPIFVMLFEKYNKPIIVVNSCRYHQPICWNGNSTMLHAFHKTLHNLTTNNLLTIIHNNRGDEWFFRTSVEASDTIPQYYAPSLCEYIQCMYSPSLETVLLDDPQNILHRIDLPILHRKTAPYEWKHLYQHRAVIVIPRETSYMTFFEYLQACIPIIIPTKRMLQELIHRHGLSLGTLRSYNLVHTDLSPWIDRADYYRADVLEACITFDSLQELENILTDQNLSIRLDKHHQQLLHLREMTRKSVDAVWKEVFHFRIFNFIHYNFWPCLAKFHLDLDYTNEPLCQPFYQYNSIMSDEAIHSIQPHDIIFIKTDLINNFMNFVLPKILVPFRVIIGVSDHTPSELFINTLLRNPLCVHIYSTNILQTHPKITPVPIGFSEPMRVNGNPQLLYQWMNNSSGSCQSKDVDLFIRHFSTTTKCRESFQKEVETFLDDKRLFLTTMRLTFPTRDANELHSYLQRSKFAIVLRGNGIDTHFFYECILNECAPIFLNDECFPLYNRFGCCIQIQRAQGFNETFSRETLDDFYKNIDWNLEKTKILRWAYKHLK